MSTDVRSEDFDPNDPNFVPRISKIEFEPMGDGRFRWRVLDNEGRALFDELSTTNKVDYMFWVTRMLCTETAHCHWDDFEFDPDVTYEE